MEYLAQNEFKKFGEIYGSTVDLHFKVIRGEKLNAKKEFEEYLHGVKTGDSNLHLNEQHFIDYFEMLESDYKKSDFYDVSVRFNAYIDKREQTFSVGVAKDVKDPEFWAGLYAVHAIVHHQKIDTFCYKILSVTKK